MKIKLSEIKGTEPKREHGDIESLKKSIQQIGLLEPLGITLDKRLVWGRRRYQALTELGITESEVVVVNPANEYEFFLMALHENTKRKNLNEIEDAQCELEQKRLYEQQFPTTTAGGDRKSKPQVTDLKVPSYTEVKANLEGVSRDTIERRIRIATAIKEHPELANYESGQRVLTEARRIEAPEPKPLPLELFNVIYADPPWQYSNNGISGAADNHYHTMPIEELSALKIPSADNAVLFMWVTNPLLAEAMPLITAWGFEYKTNMVWVKDIAGQGFYVKGQHELLLICVKGNMRPLDTLYIRSVVSEPRQEHSQKPVKFYEIIETLYPGGKYLELFARNTRPGWTSWGDEL
jgi:N6-adenosine-specific RNA methylase IME4